MCLRDRTSACGAGHPCPFKPLEIQQKTVMDEAKIILGAWKGTYQGSNLQQPLEEAISCCLMMLSKFLRHGGIHFCPHIFPSRPTPALCKMEALPTSSFPFPLIFRETPPQHRQQHVHKYPLLFPQISISLLLRLCCSNKLGVQHLHISCFQVFDKAGI